MKLKAVEVTYYDIESDNGWFEFTPKMLTAIKPITACGYLVHRDEDWLLLSFTYNPGAKDWHASFAIPAGLVKSVKILKTRTA